MLLIYVKINKETTVLESQRTINVPTLISTLIRHLTLKDFEAAY